MAMQIKITDAGRAEIINASNTGTAPVTITEVGLGTGQYAPDPTQTELQTETKRLNAIAGQVVADDTIHVTIKDETNDAYDVSEFGLYTENGTLFAVYSDVNGAFAQKASESSLLLAIDVIIGTLDATNLTFGDTSFTNPPASETVSGVAKVATQTDTNTGTDDTKFVTPKKLKAWVKQATESVFGLMKVATQAQTDTGTNDTVAVTPKKIRWGFSISLAQNGYVVLPTWLGGLIIQWGRYIPTNDDYPVLFNIVYPNNCFVVIAEVDEYTAYKTGVTGIGRDKFYSQHEVNNISIRYFSLGN